MVGAERGKGKAQITTAQIGLVAGAPGAKGSQGLRDFVKQNYKELKTANPSFPFLVRECEGTEAKVWARYDLGVEKSLSLEGQTAKNVEASLKEFLN